MYAEFHGKPPKLPKGEIETLIQELKSIRDIATMKTASFHSFHPEQKRLDAELREKTRVWRQSWIIGPLEELIQRYETAITEQYGKSPAPTG